MAPVDGLDRDEIADIAIIVIIWSGRIKCKIFYVSHIYMGEISQGVQSLNLVSYFLYF